jgi:restriction system protein
MGRRSGLEGFLRAAGRAAAAAQRESKRQQRIKETEQKQLERQQRKEVAQLLREIRAYELTEREAAREAKAAHLEARQVEADDLNADLKDRLEELEVLLLHTLSVDDTVSFDSLRHTELYPAFKVPKDLAPGVAPVATEAAPPTGFARFLPGAGKRYLAAQATAQQTHQHELELFQLAEAQKKQRLADLRAQHEAARTLYEADVARRNAEVDEFQAAYLAHEPDAVVAYNDMVLTRSEYPTEGFPQAFKLAYAEASKELVIEYDLPEASVVPSEADYRYVKTRDAIESKARRASDIKSLYQDIIASIALRTLHEAFEADQADALALVTFNGVVDTHDPSTGQEVRVPLVSVRATKAAFLQLRLERVEKVACLRSLGAQVSNRPDELQAIKPIVEFNMVDKRFIAQSDVLSGLESRPNLLDLSPGEFEALVSNLFGRMGLDTKLTRSSRDGGVDAVAFDTRPVLGGKVVIQAKRYRDTVGVSAVRDLYGTMLNEGASKGILVCTSGYGTAAFDFAKDKPIELIDGGGLLYLLREHAGLDARIAA